MKNMGVRAKVEKELKKYPYVRWDRFTGGTGDSQLSIYGWIDRPQDAYKDFIVLYFEDDVVDSYITSSAEYSLRIYKTLNDDGRGHAKCKRVESYFRVHNSIKLKRKCA